MKSNIALILPNIFELNCRNVNVNKLNSLLYDELYDESDFVFFAVDYDATLSDIRGHIVPYFRAIVSVLKPDSVGVYGSRMVCLELEKEELAAVSFVADMSHGYGGNKGKPMPKNWAYAQIKGNKVGSLCIDECVKSERATAFIPA